MVYYDSKKQQTFEVPGKMLQETVPENLYTKTNCNEIATLQQKLNSMKANPNPNTDEAVLKAIYLNIEREITRLRFAPITTGEAIELGMIHDNPKPAPKPAPEPVVESPEEYEFTEPDEPEPAAVPEFVIEEIETVQPSKVVDTVDLDDAEIDWEKLYAEHNQDETDEPEFLDEIKF